MLHFLEINVVGTDHPTTIAVRRIDQLYPGQDGDGGSVIFLDGDIQGVKINESYRDMADKLYISSTHGEQAGQVSRRHVD